MKRRRLSKWLSGMLCGALLFANIGTGNVLYAAEPTSEEEIGEVLDNSLETESVSGNCLTVEFSPEFKQTEARSMLSDVNKLRTTKDMAWYWKDDTGSDEKIQCTDLKELQWDSRLEEIAMQRAAELAINYDHTRPNGARWTTAYKGMYALGECIAAGSTYTSAKVTYKSWEEENAKTYTAQIHRRIMLNQSADAIGIGCVYYNGIYCWAMELSPASKIETAGDPVDEARKAQVEVSESMLTSFSWSTVEDQSIPFGGSVPLPIAKADLGTEKTYKYGYGAMGAIVHGLTVIAQWEAADPTVAQISGGQIKGIKAGETTIRTTVTVQGEENPLQFTLTVEGTALTEENVTLSENTCQATGSPVEPKPIVVYGDKTLEEGVDYKLTYENNTAIGTATVKVTGIGGFTGSIVKEFRIVCDHEYNENGVCTKCGYKIPTASDLIFHAPENLIYNAEEKCATLDGKEGMGEITLSYYDSKGELLSSAPVNAGTYTVKARVEEGISYGSAVDLTDSSWGFTIEKAPLTITAENVRIRKDAQDIPYSYKAEGLFGKDGEEISINVTYESTVKKDDDGNYEVGTYEITPSGPAELENYKVTYQLGYLTVTEENRETQIPKSIAFNDLKTTMYTGQTQNIIVTLNKKYEEDLIRLNYGTSDTSVLSVNSVTGVAKAMKAGTATVTVTATDQEGNFLQKSSTITVKNPTAPKSVKASAVRDTSVAVSWAKNATGQTFELYAVPYEEAYDAETRKTAAKWKEYIEAELDKSPGTKAAWADTCVTADADCTRVEIGGLTADTPYLFYIRNTAENADKELVYAGAVSGRTVTKRTIFADLEMTAKSGAANASGDSFTVESSDSLGTKGLPDKLSYQLLDSEEKELDQTLITSAVYKSSNTNVVKVDESGNLTLGTQAGTARLYVTGKDSSNAVRTSNVITIQVKKAPSGLKAKTTTLALGQSITLKELISYDGVKGSVSEFDTDGIQFQAVLDQLPKEYFTINKAETEPDLGNTKITAKALIPNAAGKPSSGGTVQTADFVLNKGGMTSSAAAVVKINDMSAPTIKKVTPGDTSISFTFVCNNTVKELTGKEYYYTATVKDMVTNGEAELRQDENGQTVFVRQEGIINEDLTAEFIEAPDLTVKTPLNTCVIKGLSESKKYQISVTAHYNSGTDNSKSSGVKNVTTKKRLLSSENGIEITYISLPELIRTPEAEGTYIFDKTKVATEEYGHITLENNETYILMAKVSRLARAEETDKLKWTITSGDKKAATIKVNASTFEAQLNAVRTGTFTVSVSSTVTKEVLSTFTVTIIPYQSSKAE